MSTHSSRGILSILLISCTVCAAKLPETYSLLTAPVKGCAVADGVVYAVYSNAVWQCAYGRREWHKKAALPFREKDEVLRSIRAVWAQPRLLYLLSSRYLYLSGDAGLSWSARRLESATRRYNDVCVFPNETSRIMLATSDGAWMSYDNGQTFHRFFQRVNSKENYINTICVDMRGERVYIASASCLFVSSDKGKSFRKMLGLPQSDVTHISASPLQTDALVFVSQKRLFYSDTRLETFVLLSDIYDFSACQQVLIAANGRDVVWSYPGGVRWGKDWLPLSLPEPTALTTAGEIADADSQKPAETAPTQDVVRTRYDSQVLTNARQRILEERYAQVMARIRREPSAREVLDAAFTYAALHPERIKEWLKKARQSAWLPELRLLGGGQVDSSDDYGREGSPADGNPNVNPLQLYRRSSHAEGGSYRAEAELSWSFGKVFFNPDEVLIDQQRNRQTELREDIANTVTIYYFQRRNMLFRKLFNPPKDLTELSRLEFQIEELTTKLDSLSGGYFSKQLAKNLK